MRIAILVADGVDESELKESRKALESRGARVTVLSPNPGRVRSTRRLGSGKPIEVESTLAETRPTDHDAILIPGGRLSPDILRQSEAALELVRSFEQNGKPIAVIGHGALVLSSAGLMDGRKLTSSPAIRDDIRNSGGFWMDEPVVSDHNWVSGRSDELDAFLRATVKTFARHAPEIPPAEKRAGMSRRTKLLVGAVAAGAIGYLVNRRSKSD
ncbi:MAG TPA: DJ-1/PfpI family protein [Thermoanaerobaculia bacterium]|nr:DJ-1/PfpI family protein [Thermoanaerobaculia bacterium]